MLSNPIRSLVGDRRQRLLGRGTSALWAALEAMAGRDGGRGEVIVPDLVCPDVLEAVVRAGYTPLLADVDPDTYSLTPETVRPLIGERTRAVIVVHLFGHAAPIEAIAELAQEAGVRLIEDAVQGIGGRTVDGNPIGTHGDFAFISFDPTKTIRGEGGVLLWDDDAWTPGVESAAQTIQAVGITASEQMLHVSRRDLYHGLGQGLRQGKIDPRTAAESFRSSLGIYGPLLLRRFDDRDDNVTLIEGELGALNENVGKRRQKIAALREALAGLPVEQPPQREGDAIWRYTVRFPTGDAADAFVVRLREAGGLCSHLYYPLNQFWEPDASYRSNDLARRLVNLFVDDHVGPDYPDLVERAGRSVLGTA